MVPADSDGASPTPPYSGYTPPKHLASTGLSPCAARLPRRFEFNVFGLCMSYNPRRTVIRLVWALPRSLATTWGITIVFSSSCYLDVSVHRVRLPVARDSSPSDWRVAPFGHPRIVSLCADPRGFSQLAASFFASESQGIPRMLLLSSSFPLFRGGNPNSYSLSIHHVKELFHGLLPRIAVPQRYHCRVWRITDSNR